MANQNPLPHKITVENPTADYFYCQCCHRTEQPYEKVTSKRFVNIDLTTGDGESPTTTQGIRLCRSCAKKLLIGLLDTVYEDYDLVINKPANSTEPNIHAVRI